MSCHLQVWQFLALELSPCWVSMNCFKINGFTGFQWLSYVSSFRKDRDWHLGTGILPTRCSGLSPLQSNCGGNSASARAGQRQLGVLSCTTQCLGCLALDALALVACCYRWLLISQGVPEEQWKMWLGKPCMPADPAYFLRPEVPLHEKAGRRGQEA